MNTRMIIFSSMIFTLVILLFSSLYEFEETTVVSAQTECTSSVPPTTIEVQETTIEETTVEETNAKLFELTAYCACEKCCGKSDGITATGTKATQGRTIAVDPNVIPYGSEVIINGHTYIAEDCGGAIKGNRIDVYFDDHDEALAFGRQSAVVYIN